MRLSFRSLREMRRKFGLHAKHLFWTKVQLALTFLWAALSILLTFAANYLASKGNIR